MAAAVVAFADTVVGADRVAADGAGRTPMTARPARALVRVDAAPPRRQRTGSGRGERRGVVRPKAVPTSAEISTGNVDAFGGHRVAGRHAFRTLVNVCSPHIFTLFSNAQIAGGYQLSLYRIIVLRERSASKHSFCRLSPGG